MDKLTKIALKYIPFFFVACIIGVAVMVLMSMQSGDDLHDDAVEFCRYWGESESHCNIWADQRLAANRGPIRMCLELYEDGSLVEFSCVAGVIDSE